MDFWNWSLKRKIGKNLRIIKWIVILKKLKNKIPWNWNLEITTINCLIWRKGNIITVY